MKNYIKVFIYLIIGVSVIGCDLIEENLNPKQEPEELILGNWYETGYTVDGEYSEWPADDLRMYDYQDDGVISVFDYKDGELTIRGSLSYVLKEDTLEITGQNTTIYTIVKLDESELIYEREMDVNGDGELSLVEYYHERRY